MRPKGSSLVHEVLRHNCSVAERKTNPQGLARASAKMCGNLVNGPPRATLIFAVAYDNLIWFGRVITRPVS